MTYDSWKTRAPEDERDFDLSEPPEEWEDCPDCGGEGGYEKAIRTYEAGCGFWHWDGYWVICETCNGAGFDVVKAVGRVVGAPGLSTPFPEWDE